MVFSSYEFIFMYLPLVIIAYFTIGKHFSKIVQHVFLVGASLFFYGYFNPSYLLIIITSILANYFIATLIQKINNERHRKIVFISGLIFNIGLLGYFKYYDFIIENINFISGMKFSLKHLLLPLGISFFTFQQFSFLLSVYKREERVENFVDYSLFVTFFPQLVAGPIVLYSEMIPQFKDDNRTKANYDNIAKGVYIFVIGLFKKIVIADTLAIFVSNGFDVATDLGFIAAWLTSLAYTLQIYFDFSGYSDMAIGIGKMLNIDLPHNFNSPYKSASVGEFWKRWHITLGRALSTYIYKPLGGNRKGLYRTCLNLIIVFLVSGLWHGAAWTFVVWGLLHGLLSAFERIFKKQLDLIPHFIRVLGTFIFINTTWVLFRATSWESALKVLKGMYLPNNIDFSTVISNLDIIGIIIILLIVVFTKLNSNEKVQKFTFNNKSLVFITLIFTVAVIHLSRVSVFIYFNF